MFGDTLRPIGIGDLFFQIYKLCNSEEGSDAKLDFKLLFKSTTPK